MKPVTMRKSRDASVCRWSALHGDSSARPAEADRFWNRKKGLCSRKHRLYKSHQMKNLLSMMRAWCRVSGCTYSCSIVISAGELIGVLIKYMESRPVRGVTNALAALAENVTAGTKMEDFYVQPLMFPRWLYIQIANRSWDRQALASNMKPADLKICPQYEE